jgi:hypothetical protein
MMHGTTNVKEKVIRLSALRTGRLYPPTLQSYWVQHPRELQQPQTSVHHIFKNINIDVMETKNNEPKEDI